jgi:eukaryotic-like serine/threonine-protein kinase
MKVHVRLARAPKVWSARRCSAGAVCSTGDFVAPRLETGATEAKLGGNPDVVVGQILAGKYRVERVIGEGGMGYVVAAYHLQLHTTVAIKLLAPKLLTDAEALARFASEARAAARVVSAHVARVLDVGTLDNGAPYMVMELLEGEDLASVLRTQRLSIAQAIDYVLQACEAIAEAHTLGIIHRDLKPANLFCARRPDGTSWIKVLDFGISKVAHNTAGLSMTTTSATLGSPFYMSPEQMQSTSGVDARTDIWAIGVILYELITGRRPFDGLTLPDVCVRIATRSPAPMKDLRPGVAAALESVVLRCLEKDREKRYPNVGELALALANLATPKGKLSVETIVRTLEQGRQAPASRNSNPEWKPGAIIDLKAYAVGPRQFTRPRWLRQAKGKAAIAVAIGAILGFGAIAVFGSLQERSIPSQLPSPAAAQGLLAPTTPQVPPTETTAATGNPPPAAQASNSATSVSLRPTAPQKPSTSVSPVKPHPNCDPNYSLDARGDKHFKPECFR